MAKAELKTKPNRKSVSRFLRSVKDPQRRQECAAVLRLMKAVTRTRPTLWGASIVGFGTYHYRSSSGREGDWFLTGFSPRKDNLTLYVMSGFQNHKALMKQLGKHKTSVGCLYLKSLDDVNMSVLKKLVTASVKIMKKRGRSGEE